MGFSGFLRVNDSHKLWEGVAGEQGGERRLSPFSQQPPSNGSGKGREVGDG